MTLEQLNGALGPDFEVTEEVEVTPGQLGHVVSSDGGVWALVTVADGVIDMIVLVDTAFTTAEGIGPGSTVAAAEEVYGAATMTWFPDDQGQEIAEFASGPAALQLFTSDSGGPRAGVYNDDQTSTVVIKPDAVITTIRLTCAASPCAYDGQAAADADVADADADDEEPAEDPEAEADTSAEDADDETATGEDDDAEGNELASTGTTSKFTAGLGLSLLGSGSLAVALARRRPR